MVLKIMYYLSYCNNLKYLQNFDYESISNEIINLYCNDPDFDIICISEENLFLCNALSNDKLNKPYSRGPINERCCFNDNIKMYLWEIIEFDASAFDLNEFVNNDFTFFLNLEDVSNIIVRGLTSQQMYSSAPTEPVEIVFDVQKYLKLKLFK